MVHFTRVLGGGRGQHAAAMSPRLLQGVWSRCLRDSPTAGGAGPSPATCPSAWKRRTLRVSEAAQGGPEGGRTTELSPSSSGHPGDLSRAGPGSGELKTVSKQSGPGRPSLPRAPVAQFHHALAAPPRRARKFRPPTP